jgi:hypothetical protein
MTAGGASGATGPVGERMGGAIGGAAGAPGRAPGIGTPAAGRPIIVRPTGGAAGRGGIDPPGVGAAGPASGRTGAVPGRAGGIAPGRMPGIREGRIAGTPCGGDDRSDAGIPGGPPTTGIPAPVARGAAATAGAPVVIGSGVAGPEESMLISP